VPKYLECPKCGRLYNRRAPNTHQCSGYIAKVTRDRLAEQRAKDQNKQKEYAALRVIHGG